MDRLSQLNRDYRIVSPMHEHCFLDNGYFIPGITYRPTGKNQTNYYKLGSTYSPALKNL
jgi:hypothetical protein